jgi:hypothetical protein
MAGSQCGNVEMKGLQLQAGRDTRVRHQLGNLVDEHLSKVQLVLMNIVGLERARQALGLA